MPLATRRKYERIKRKTLGVLTWEALGELSGLHDGCDLKKGKQIPKQLGSNRSNGFRGEKWVYLPLTSGCRARVTQPLPISIFAPNPFLKMI